ncbi:calumenin-B-like [Pollicipes pollicipes]|uniref:calumenin-B-like n=1 Tax=Pollicipes pollicipes TaxID=41117 RepID=UPI0018856637|nr:calumenin-B-like [Pollicipes pollicipes]XP_037088011.1 calumenin-B-like [Pollicipes pollicipes]
MKWMLVLVLCHLVLVIHAEDEEKHEGRIIDKKLSDADHFEGDEHNTDYDHDAFLGDEAEEFNDLTPEESKERLSLIVDKIDVDGDGMVSEEELIGWIKQAQNRYMETEVERQWEAHAPASKQDKEHITWDDYQQSTYGFTGEAQENEEGDAAAYQRMIGRDQRRWNAADVDKDGKLSRLEFSTFLHPEEVEHMRDIVVLETIEDIDKNNDGKITVDEYIGDMFDEADGAEPDWVQHEREQFKTTRDTDGNGYLDADEVRAWIMPSDYDHSLAETQHLVHEADADGDGMLSRQEILDKYDLFVGSQATDFGNALYSHDEL